MLLGNRFARSNAARSARWSATPLFVAWCAFVAMTLARPAWAAGSSGYVVPAQVQVEGGNVYVFGPFQNPDGCASSNMDVLAAANMEELARMMSMAMTAVASGKKISFWFNACKPAPWAASAPQAVSMGFHAG